MAENTPTGLPEKKTEQGLTEALRQTVEKTRNSNNLQVFIDRMPPSLTTAIRGGIPRREVVFDMLRLEKPEHFKNFRASSKDLGDDLLRLTQQAGINIQEDQGVSLESVAQVYLKEVYGLDIDNPPPRPPRIQQFGSALQEFLSQPSYNPQSKVKPPRQETVPPHTGDANSSLEQNTSNHQRDASKATEWDHRQWALKQLDNLQKEPIINTNGNMSTQEKQPTQQTPISEDQIVKNWETGLCQEGSNDHVSNKLSSSPVLKNPTDINRQPRSIEPEPIDFTKQLQQLREENVSLRNQINTMQTLYTKQNELMTSLLTNINQLVSTITSNMATGDRQPIELSKKTENLLVLPPNKSSNNTKIHLPLTQKEKFLLERAKKRQREDLQKNFANVTKDLSALKDELGVAGKFGFLPDSGKRTPSLRQTISQLTAEEQRLAGDMQLLETREEKNQNISQPKGTDLRQNLQETQKSEQEAPYEPAQKRTTEVQPKTTTQQPATLAPERKMDQVPELNAVPIKVVPIKTKAPIPVDQPAPEPEAVGELPEEPPSKPAVPPQKPVEDLKPKLNLQTLMYEVTSAITSRPYNPAENPFVVMTNEEKDDLLRKSTQKAYNIEL